MTAGDSPDELLAVAMDAARQAGTYLAARDPYGAREPAAAIQPALRTIRSGGSAVLELCYVATGLFRGLHDLLSVTAYG